MKGRMTGKKKRDSVKTKRRVRTTEGKRKGGCEKEKETVTENGRENIGTNEVRVSIIKM